MRKRLNNLKWLLPMYFLAASVGTLLLGVGGWFYLTTHMESPGAALWVEYFIIILLIAPVVGYFLARSYQRKMDALQLSIKQVTKGNLGERLEVLPADLFGELYQDFNTMAASLESRLRLLQQEGSADVMRNMQSSQDAVLEERRRLARDLHDTVSQQLFAIHMSASSLPKLLEINPEGARIVVEQLVTMSHHAQRQMRSLIAQLRPLELEEQTLEEALGKWFPDYCNQNGLKGRLEISLPGELPEAIEYQLFLIIQEGMANVVKHAKANRVSLVLYEAGSQYVLQIEDDGIGFEPNVEKRSSYGLATMRERAERLGGDAEVRSKPGAGTAVHIRIPKFVETESGEEA
ncbi:histidine kinase [Paenibacillus mesotrionivorans]|jgi:NarL family two-component system sensor histidine kinase LiaS|uniref:Histidine kinase n=1 Tax=Paenibacillus mesotrionivorans TaxID=3160968 RepID=A0ACC7NU39_9BACL